jgi:hypothetical protein
MIGEAIGGRLRYQELPPAAKQGMIAHGLPRAFVQAPMVRYARQVGAASAVTGQVERILGRPAPLCPVGRRPRRRRFGHPAPDPPRSTRAGPGMPPEE